MLFWKHTRNQRINTHCNNFERYLGKPPYWLYVMTQLRPVSFVRQKIKSEAVISREQFDLESQNFTGTFAPVGCTTAPDMTSLYTSGRKLSTFERQPKKETLSKALTQNHQIWYIHPYRRTEQPYRIWRHWLLPVGSYQSFYIKKRSKMPGGISRERFKGGSRNFAWLSWTIGLPTCRIWRH